MSISCLIYTPSEYLLIVKRIKNSRLAHRLIPLLDVSQYTQYLEFSSWETYQRQWRRSKDLLDKSRDEDPAIS